jgi:hypothetical protein
MKTINFRRVLAAGGVIALVIVYPMLWLRMITSPAERTGSDFIAFFAAGQVTRVYGSGEVYQPGLQQSVQEQVVGFPLIPGQVLLFNHVPYLVPILKLVVSTDYVASFLRWTVMLVALFVLGTVLLVWLLRRVGWDRPARLLAAAGLLTFFPLFVSLMNGQDTAFAALGACLWLFGLLTDQDWLAGFGLALTSARPQIAVFLTFPFLFRRQRVFLWAVIAAAALGLVSLASVGLAGLRGFLDLLLVSAGGAWYGMKEAEMVNLIGLLWRLFPGLGPEAIHVIGWAAYAAGLLGLAIAWIRSRSIGAEQAGLAVILALFLAPHLHYHDLTMLLVPLTGWMLTRTRRLPGGDRDTALLPLGASMFLLLGSLVPALKNNLPYVLMVFLVLWYPVYDRIRTRTGRAATAGRDPGEGR